MVWLMRVAMILMLGSFGISLVRAEVSDFPTPDIEIWLSEGIGRFGDFEFSVLGGKPDHPTPRGAFQIEWKSRSWWSKQFNAPMPYSQFFSGGSAIHEGSLSYMSHGCLHVSKSAARYLYYATREKTTRVFVYP
ncbi:hypothetical protein CVU37_07590 [candidate division BRC1 bacterium HGW-BRC1-1]|jgi:lipoprotein-anchoring transpeptidase ErfK/SrfK|nr:MAG: hypothetical protein CVU37_07590 [candidate division BRC1 bacterium HGW-BRC1-1]